MGVMATWGPKKFEVNTKKLTPVSGLSTAYKLKSDANSDTSGTTPTNTRGLELEEVSFSVRYLAAAGVSVRNEFGSWRPLIGQSYPLIIGGVRFGPEKFQLMSATISETMLDVNGNFLAATVALAFKEYVPDNKAATATSTVKNGGSTGTGAGTSAKGTTSTGAKSMAEQIAAEKQKALSTTASTEDKVKRNKTGTVKGATAY